MKKMYTPSIEKAIAFANGAHCAAKHRRKYTSEPYIYHPVRVMHLMNQAKLVTDSMRLASILHDVVEGTGVTLMDIQENFGTSVMDLVDQLTERETHDESNRAARFEINRLFTAKISPNAKTIRLADLIDNCTDIVKHDSHFAKTYLEEKRLLLGVLTEGDELLYRKAFSLVSSSIKKLKEIA